jgi:hypothetical protein
LREECSIIHHVQPLQYSQYNTSKPLAFLFLGGVCKKNLGFRCLQQDLSLPADLINQAKGQKGSCKICTNDRVTFSHFNIFGMHHACRNDGYLKLSTGITQPGGSASKPIDRI